MKRSLVLTPFVFLIALAGAARYAQGPQRQLTAEQQAQMQAQQAATREDHQRMLMLLGKKDLGTMEFPPIETGLMDGDVAFRQHSAGHTPGPNWPVFLTFASRYFK